MFCDTIAARRFYRLSSTPRGAGLNGSLNCNRSWTWATLTLTGRTGALHGTSSMEPISAVSLLVTLQLFCVFFLVSCSTCFVSRIAGVLAALSNLFYGQFWGFRLRDRKVLSNEPHTDFETHLFPAGCGTISIHNCMCIVSGCQLSR